MSEVPLARKYSAGTYDKALSNVVNRWVQNNGEGPVKYDEAAIGMDKSTVSVALKYLAQIGLLESPKAGSYNVPDEVVDYENKIGQVQEQAKRAVKERIGNYPLYSEAIFYLNVDDFTLDELVEDVAGSSEVAASQDEVADVKRSLKILAELEFLKIGEDGAVSVPDDLRGESDTNGDQLPEQSSDEEQADTKEEHSTPENGGAQAKQDGGAPASSADGHVQSQLVSDVDVSIDATEMGAEDLRKKLEIIDDVLGRDEA